MGGDALVGEAKGQAVFYHQVALQVLSSFDMGLGFRNLAHHLIRLAEQAYAFRRRPALNEISQILMNLPLPGAYRSAGLYYHALSLLANGRGELDRARTILEGLEAHAPTFYRSRALLSLGAIARYQADHLAAQSFYLDAGRLALHSGQFDLQTLLGSQLMIAVCRSVAGDHQGALRFLNELAPLAETARRAQPHLYFDYLNSCAVELAEVGRFAEAREHVRRAVASPYAAAYPTWRETLDEIKEKEGAATPGVVAVHKRGKAEEMAMVFRRKRNQALKQSRRRYYGQPAKVLPFPPPPPEGLAPEEPRQVSARELKRMGLRKLQALLVTLIFADGTTRETLEDMLVAGGLVVGELEAVPKEIPLDDPGELSKLVMRWVNGDLTPDEFASVMSALRDCKDNLRRTNIIDQMISCAFNETPERLRGEDAWRRRVEAHLPPESDSDERDA